MNLSQISLNFKSAVKYIAVGLAALFVIWLLWLLLSFVFNLINPPKLTADLGFGNLSKPFAYNSTFSSTFFTLDTPGGNLPLPPSLLKVYSIPNLEGKFTSLDNAKQIAQSNSLDADPVRLSENEWRFISKKNPSRVLTYNIVTGNFNFSYDWVSDPSSLVGVFKTTDNKIIDKARSFLYSFKSLKPDLKKSQTRITFWKLIGKNRNQVSSYSEANAVRIEIFRDKIDGKYDIVEGNTNLASINILISAAQRPDQQLLELNFTYWDYDTKQFATYPPKPASQAFDELKSGKAYIAAGQTEAFENINVFEVNLAYFNPTTVVKYFQPVYVFKGEGLVKGVRKSFVAYLPAVSSSYQQ